MPQTLQCGGQNESRIIMYSAMDLTGFEDADTDFNNTNKVARDVDF